MSRIEKVAQQLKREISQILLLEMKDPRIVFLTVTRVKVSSDLSLAKIYYTVLGDEDTKLKVQQGLEHAVNYIRRLIAQRMKLRFIPKLEFYYDDELKKTLELEKLLDELRDENNRESKK